MDAKLVFDLNSVNTCLRAVQGNEDIIIKDSTSSDSLRISINDTRASAMMASVIRIMLKKNTASSIEFYNELERILHELKQDIVDKIKTEASKL